MGEAVGAETLGDYSLGMYRGSAGPVGPVGGLGEERENGVEEGRRKEVTLIVKAATIDASRIGADLFCQEFWMELYALYELGLLKVDIKAANINSEPFKRNFLGSQPPILVEADGSTVTDNRDLESRIFHLAKEFSVPLFEKDLTVETKIENLYRNFKIYLRTSIEAKKGAGAGGGGSVASVGPSFNKLMEQLTGINALLRTRGTRYLLGSSMTEYDCELMPRLHHIRVAGAELCGLDIPGDLLHLWAYLLTTYRTAAFIESCPADQDIIYHYKEQLNLTYARSRESLQKPTKTHTIPQGALEEIKRLGL